jgi:hypothetical protein
LPAKPPEQPHDDEPTPIPGELLREVVVGYETRRFQGFTFLLSTQAVTESGKIKGKPWKALRVEFDGLVRVLPKAALKYLRRVLVWVE